MTHVPILHPLLTPSVWFSDNRTAVHPQLGSPAAMCVGLSWSAFCRDNSSLVKSVGQQGSASQPPARSGNNWYPGAFDLYLATWRASMRWWNRRPAAAAASRSTPHKTNSSALSSARVVTWAWHVYNRTISALLTLNSAVQIPPDRFAFEIYTASENGVTRRTCELSPRPQRCLREASPCRVMMLQIASHLTGSALVTARCEK